MRRARLIFEPQPENWLTEEKVARLCAAVNSRFNGPDDQEMRDAIVATIYRAQLMQAALLPKPEGHPTATSLRFAHLVIDLQARYRVTHNKAREIVASVVAGVTVDSLESAQERVRKSGGVAGADLAANGGVHKQFRALVRNTADRLARELKLRPRADIATYKEARAQEIERMTELHATEMAQLDAEAPDLAKFVRQDSLTLKGAMIQLEARRQRLRLRARRKRTP
jgi:hypothetical protein